MESKVGQCHLRKNQDEREQNEFTQQKRPFPTWHQSTQKFSKDSAIRDSVSRDLSLW